MTNRKQFTKQVKYSKNFKNGVNNNYHLNLNNLANHIKRHVKLSNISFNITVGAPDVGGIDW